MAESNSPGRAREHSQLRTALPEAVRCPPCATNNAWHWRIDGVPECATTVVNEEYARGWNAARDAASCGVLVPDGYLLAPVILAPAQISAIKDLLADEYRMHDIKARPLWASLLAIVAGVSLEAQEQLLLAEAYKAPAPLTQRTTAEDRGPAWSPSDMSKPWGAEVAFLRHLANDPALIAEQAAMLRHCANRIEATASDAGEALLGKYADVLRPFLSMMEHELHANAGKGDRPGWLAMSRHTALLEIYYHVAKLQKAVHDEDAARIGEHAADVANMAMMLADLCHALLTPTRAAPSKSEEPGASC